MDEHALRVLEFDKVISRVTRLTSFPAGRDLAELLRPITVYEDVLERQNLLAEAIRFRQFRTPMSLTDAADIRPALEKAALDGILESQDLLAVAATQRAAQQARSGLNRAAASLPRLGNLGQRLTDLPAIISEIGRSLDQRGEMLDSASQALSLLRRNIKIAHDRLHSKLQDFLSSSAGRLAAQESIVTLRDGRYVVPIKADFRGEVRGIVHDVSASGATVFVEPLVVVELANQWRELQIEERREIDRILRRLSNLVGAAATELAQNVVCLAELDLLLAKARFAEELGSNNQPVLPASEPESNPESWLVQSPSQFHLVEARHPLLQAPVPVTIRLDGDDRVLLITGPNTGGKTVALKTVGLLCAMAQAGLPVPAEESSKISVFEELLADIGDEQSIEQSLSTFSGHLMNVIALLDKAGPRSLVLLDELAAGTDPAEGAALAKALLMNLMSKGALTIATTHHGELKLFAHSEPGILNAAVEFDSETLAPTFRIKLGVPGRSNALAIAARLGLPESILREAQESLAPDQVAIDSLLSDLREEHAAAETARQAEERARRQAEDAKERIEERLAGLDDEKARRLDEAAFALEQEVAAAREALSRAQKAAARQATSPTPEDVSEIHEAVTAATDTARRLRRRSRRRPKAPPQIDQIQTGTQIWLDGIPMAAEALSAPDTRGELEVSLGGLRARISVSQIIWLEKPAQRALEAIAVPVPAVVADQIEVRGQTLDEALPKLEQFLDEGFRAGFPRLRIVHGKGTGKMRNAVRELLTRHPLVKDFSFATRPEGGEGVTIAEMALSAPQQSKELPTHNVLR